MASCRCGGLFKFMILYYSHNIIPKREKTGSSRGGAGSAQKLPPSVRYLSIYGITGNYPERKGEETHILAQAAFKDLFAVQDNLLQVRVAFLSAKELRVKLIDPGVTLEVSTLGLQSEKIWREPVVPGGVALAP